MLRYLFFWTGLVSLSSAASFAQEWPTYSNDTSNRMPTGPGLNDPTVSTTDVAEKNYAWGDVDQDGDIDLVCVRKQPYNTTGRRRNVLFMNEGVADGHALDGVLVDRTMAYAMQATDSGQGFLDLTNDRDVVLLDVDGDGWLDIVTTTTYGQDLPKTISHPRVYLNLGEVDGEWQGFRYEEVRTPTLPMAPNFCGIGHGDVTGNGFPDLYHIDYNHDLEDRLWINDGTGHFVDESELRMTFEMLESEFGVHAVIADMNGDGVKDVVKNRANGAPYRITISYNDPDDEGFFDAFETVYTGAPYYVAVADLNNDGLLDIVLQDDGIDRYYLNQGNAPDGVADFLGFTFPPQSNGFEGTMEVADLNNDGFIDVLITDETVNAVGVLCSSRMLIWRNLGNVPNITFEEADGGIPVPARRGTFDVAPFDIDGDGWRDLVIGTCSGTSVWMSQPPLGMNYSYPNGIPAVVALDGSTAVQVQIDPVGDSLDPSSPMINVSVNGGVFDNMPLEHIAGNLYSASFGAQECLNQLDFYFSAQLAGGALFSDPPNAPADTFDALAAAGTETSFSDSIEGDVSGWAIISDASLLTGEWEQAEPNGTISGGNLAAPDEDATPGAGNTKAFVTQNCEGDECSNSGDSDVDGGPTYLISPSIDLEGTDATISYARWFFTSSTGDEDLLTTEVSNNDGGTWVVVQSTLGTDGIWEVAEFRAGDYVAPTAEVRVRFGVEDVFPATIVEAGIDDFQVEQFNCEAQPCPSDLDGDGAVGPPDLAQLLASWGVCGDCPADLNGDGEVGPLDLATLLGAWGPCP